MAHATSTTASRWPARLSGTGSRRCARHPTYGTTTTSLRPDRARVDCCAHLMLGNRLRVLFGGELADRKRYRPERLPAACGGARRGWRVARRSSRRRRGRRMDPAGAGSRTARRWPERSGAAARSSAGLRTIIAHPERHAGADFSERLRRLADDGCSDPVDGRVHRRIRARGVS